MKTLSKLLLVPALCLAAASAAHAGVTVRFHNPQQYTDIGLNPDRDAVLPELHNHFIRLGQRLPPGQDLAIDVLDVDLAGRIEPVRGGTMHEVRVLRGGADWPHMRLRYTLSEQGRVIRSGEGQLSNQLYLNRIESYSAGDPLRYEKQMMDEWFGREFGVSRRPRPY